MQLVRHYDLLIRMPVIIKVKERVVTCLLLLDKAKKIHVISLNLAAMLNIHD